MGFQSVKIIAVYGFVMGLTMKNCVAGEFDQSVSDIIEPPRVERMHPDPLNFCHGNINCIRQNEESVGPVWFGPRLGRRRRSESKQPYDSEKPAWGLFSLPSRGSDKRQETTFTPRLGRELDNVMSVYDILQRTSASNNYQAQEKERSSPINLPQQPLPYPPRLGRQLISEKFQQELRDLLHKYRML